MTQYTGRVPAVTITGGVGPGYTCTVQPDAGAAITSLVSQGSQLLATGHPVTKPLSRPLNFLDTGLSGWVDCFPSVAPEEFTSAGFPGRVADHGELWSRTWQPVQVSAGSVTLEVALDDWSVAARRTVSWVGTALQVLTDITNLGRRPLPYVLASHPLLAVADDWWVRLPDQAIRWESSEGWVAQAPRLDAMWAPDSLGRRWWRDLPPRSFAKVFAPWPEHGLTFGVGPRGWHLDWTSRPAAPFLGMWLNKEAFPSGAPLAHWAPEPTIGSSDSVTLASHHGTAGCLEPGPTQRMSLRLAPIDRHV